MVGGILEQRSKQGKGSSEVNFDDFLKYLMVLKNAGAGNSFDMYVKKLNTIVDSMINEPLTPLNVPSGGSGFDSAAAAKTPSPESPIVGRKLTMTRRPSPLATSGSSSSLRGGSVSTKENSQRGAVGVAQ